MMIEKTEIDDVWTHEKGTTTIDQDHIIRLHGEVQELNHQMDQVFMALSEIMDHLGLGTVSRYLESGGDAMVKRDESEDVL